MFSLHIFKSAHKHTRQVENETLMCFARFQFHFQAQMRHDSTHKLTLKVHSVQQYDFQLNKFPFVVRFVCTWLVVVGDGLVNIKRLLGTDQQHSTCDAIRTLFSRPIPVHGKQRTLFATFEPDRLY